MSKMLHYSKNWPVSTTFVTFWYVIGTVRSNWERNILENIEYLFFFVKRSANDIEDSLDKNIVLIDQQYFKDLSNQNIRDNLYKNQLSQLEDFTTPFGIINNGLNQDKYEVDSDGTVWEKVDHPFPFA